MRRRRSQGQDLTVDEGAPIPQRPRQRARLVGASAVVLLLPVAALALAGTLPSQDLADQLGATEVLTEAPATTAVVLGREAVPEPRRLDDPKGVAVVAPPTTTTTTAPPPTTEAPEPEPEPEAAPSPAATPAPAPPTTAAPAPAPQPPPPPAPAGSVSANLDAIARCESGGNPDAYNPAGYYGAFQFSLATWHGLGFTGDPRDYTYAEQKYAAVHLVARSGYSPWPHCARSLGLI